MKRKIPVLHTAFNADGRRLVKSEVNGDSQVWDLSPDMRAAENINKLTELLSCHHIDLSGGFTVLKLDTLNRIGQELKQRRP